VRLVLRAAPIDDVGLGTWLIVLALAMRYTTVGTRSNNVIVGVMLTFVALDVPRSIASKRSGSRLDQFF
jgi:hypothetical protein